MVSLKAVFVAAVVALGAPTGQALAQADAAGGCVPSPTVIDARFDYFLGITPADSPLDAWCRIQTLTGDYKVNILFGDNVASKTFDVRFDGTPRRSKQDFAMLLQSLLPTTADQARAQEGLAFGKVLENAVQLKAALAKDGQRLSLHADHPSAKSVALWETMAIRLKPVRYAGADFTLSIHFKPSVGRLFANVGGVTERLVLNGWWENVLRDAGVGKKECSAFIPECGKLAEVIPLETAWSLDTVVMAAEGGSLSTTAHQIMASLVDSIDPALVRQNTLNDWSFTRGEAEVRISDASREVHAKAEPRVDGSGGTRRVAIRWRERERSKQSYAQRLQEYAGEFREAVFLQYSSQAGLSRQ